MSTHLGPLACAALGAALLLSGCGSSDTSDRTDAASSSRTTQTTTPTTTGSDASSPAASAGSDYTGPTIPAGLWTRHMTPAQARKNAEKAGMEPAVIEETVRAFSEDLAFSFKIGDGVWAQYEAFDGRESTVGSEGTFTYDADGNWTTISNGTGCPGCVIVYRWSVDGEQLTVHAVPGHDEDPTAIFVTDGTYQRES